VILAGIREPLPLEESQLCLAILEVEKWAVWAVPRKRGLEGGQRGCPKFSLDVCRKLASIEHRGHVRAELEEGSHGGVRDRSPR
jgi:hypothetical protein